MMNPERKIHLAATDEVSVEKQPAVLSVVKDDFVLDSASHSSEEEVKLSELAEMYKKADQTVLLSFDSNGKESFKKLGEVIKEVEVVLLRQENLSEKEVRDYMDGIVSRLRSEIQLTSQGIANEKQDEQKRLDLIQARNKKYEELLESVAAFIETGKINREQEQAVEESETSVEVVEIIDEKLISLKKKFVSLKTLLKEKGGVIKESPACIGAKKIIDIIGSLKESDLTTRRNMERTYLRNLERALTDLRSEINRLPLEASVNKNNIKIEDEDLEPIEIKSESTMFDTDVATAADNKPQYGVASGLTAEDVVNHAEKETPLNFDIKRMRSQLERDAKLYMERFDSFAGPSFGTERKAFANYEKIRDVVVVLLENGISEDNMGEYIKAKDEYDAVRRNIVQIFIENDLLSEPNTTKIKNEIIAENEVSQNTEVKEEGINNEEDLDSILTVAQFTSLLWSDNIQLFPDGRMKTGFDEPTTNLLNEYSEKKNLLDVLIANNIPNNDQRFIDAGAKYLKIRKILLSKGILDVKKEKVVDIIAVESESDNIDGFIRRRKVDENGNTLQEVADVKVDTPVEELIDNKKERGAWLKAREIFKKRELEYEKAIASYYSDYHNNDSWRSKINKTVDSTKKIFGINPDLPLSLRLIKEDYKFARADYVASLDTALTKRASIKGNKEFNLNDDKTKIAFGRKFIINPNQEQLKIQAQNALSPESQNRLSSIMNKFSKYKWHSRVGSVALYGALGAASGGVGAIAVGAGWQAWKIAASSVAGVMAGKYARKKMQVRIDAATDNIKTAEEMSARNFSLQELNNLEDDLQAAYSAKDIAERRQRAATVAAAVGAGLTTGATLHSFGSDVMELSKPDIVPEKTVNTTRVFFENSSVNEKTYAMAPKETFTEKEVFTKPVSETVLEQSIEEIPPLNALQLNPEIEITYYNLNGTPESKMVLSDIKLIGNFNTDSIPAAELEKVNETIALKANDLLSVHPNMSEIKLEKLILEKLKEDFGETDWWKKTVTSETRIDIGKIIPPNRPLPEIYEPYQNAIVPEEVEKAPATISEIAPKHVYIVEKGDNLWDVLKKEFPQELDGLAQDKQEAVLNKLMSTARVNDEVRNSLGLRSGDPELIYAGDKINLDSLGEELKRLVVLQKEDYVPYVNSADLAIESDNSVHEVPIKVVEAVPAVTPVQNEIASAGEDNLIETPVTQIEKIINPPRLFSATGNYYDSPEYKQYIVQNFGDLKTFEKTIGRAVVNFDNRTYDILERSSFFGNDYQSPYNFMHDMTLKEIQEFNSQSPAEIKNILGNENIKYETFVAWNDEINKMESKLPYGQSTKLSDLFARYVAEQSMKNVDILTKTK